ncbi:MAG: hypothetical protein V1781_07355 [Bacteroidota bacterium]
MMKDKLQTYRNFILCFILYILYLFSLSSCRKEINQPSWDTNVLSPLIKSTLTINNIIPDSLIHQNPDNSLGIVYHTELYSFSSDTLFDIPDTTLKNIYWSWFQITLNANNPIMPNNIQQIKYDFDDVQLTNATIRNGKMELNIRSQIQEKVDFTYKIPGAVDIYGNTFDTTVTIPAASATVDGIYSGIFDISGYKINFTGINGDKINTLVTNYSAIICPTCSSVTIEPGDSIIILNKFTGIVPQYAKGYFGNSVTTIGPDNTFFSLFNHITDGTLKLKDVDIKLNIENGIGADARVTIKNLSSINTRTGTTIPLSNSVIGNAININRSVDNNGAVTPSLYKADINSNNSNIKQFIENLPDKLSYQLRLELNPLGNISGNNDFIYYNKLLNTTLDMKIPLSLIANNLSLSDTVNFQMGTNADNVKGGTLFLFAENGFPFAATAQLYLMNSNNIIIDSLISTPNIILAPSLDANFVAVGKRLTKLSIPFDEKKLGLMRTSSRMMIKIKFNTAGQPNYVKIYSFYQMNIKLVGDFNYTISKNE